MELTSEVCRLIVFSKASDVNSREEFHVSIFDILCTSTQGQNFAERQGHLGNDVIYTRSHWELDLV